MAYTGQREFTTSDPAVYAVAGDCDGIANTIAAEGWMEGALAFWLEACEEQE